MIINPKTIYVLDKNENVKAVFNKDDKDTLIDPEIEEKQNSEAVLTFRVNAKSKKWKETYNPENLYLVGNKVFSANFDSCIEESKEAEGQDVIMVTAYERQKLLERNYVRAWNSTTGFDKIDEFMVVIVGKGDLDLFNNGEKVNPKYPKGSSGYVLEGLLYGTGWIVGDCDLYEYKNGNLVKDENGNPKYEIFDLETDQENIYDNIKKVQELWGGILIFDSLNKVVHHRDEVKFLPYSGYEVRYAKNLVSAKYIGNNRIITQMCPLGEGSLNIGSVNPALDENGNIIYEKVEDENGNMVNKPKPNIWLTNFSYTNSVYKSIENNPDIYEPEQLKRWGERKLQELCKPRKELSVKTVLLNESPALINTGFHYEELHLHDIVDVIDYDLIEGKTEQLRVIEFSYKVWSPDDARITLSDITLESTDIFRKAVKATNSINNGTLNTTQIIDSHKNGSSLNQSLREIDQIITTTNSELIKAQDMIKASIRETTVGIDNLNNEIVSQSQRLAEMLLQIDNISFTIENSLDLNKVIKGNTKIIIPDAIKGELISLSIHGYENSFYDKNIHFKVTTNNPDNNLTSEDPSTYIPFDSENKLYGSLSNKDLPQNNLRMLQAGFLNYQEKDGIVFEDLLIGDGNNNSTINNRYYTNKDFLNNSNNFIIKYEPSDVSFIYTVKNKDNNVINAEQILNQHPKLQVPVVKTKEEISHDIFIDLPGVIDKIFPNKYRAVILDKCKCIKFKIPKQNVYYDISKAAGSRFAVATFPSEPEPEMISNFYITTKDQKTHENNEGENATNLFLKINPEDKWLGIFLYDEAWDTLSYEEIKNSLKIIQYEFEELSPMIENLNNEYSYQIDDELREIITESNEDGDDTYITTQNGEYLVTDKYEKLITGKRIKKYYDEFRVADGKASLIRRIGKKDNGDLYLLQEPIITVLGDLTIPILQGENIIEVIRHTPDMTISYVNQNLYTDMFATRVEVKNQIAITDEKIVLLSNKTVSKGEIIQELNSQILISPDIIDISGNKIRIKSNFFELTEEGRITAKEGKIGSWTLGKEYFGYGWYEEVPSDPNNPIFHPVLGIDMMGGEDPEEKTFFAGPNKNGKYNFAVYPNGEVDLQRVNIWDVGENENEKCFIKLHNAKSQVGTYIDTNKVDAADIYGSGNSMKGKCMHSIDYTKDNANPALDRNYSCHYDGAHLLFYIDRYPGYDWSRGDFTINAGTSDKRLKKEIIAINDNLLRAINEIELIQFRYKEPGEIDKIHIGIVAQDLVKISKKYKVNIFDYDIVFGNGIGKNYYSINYPQLQMLKIKCLENKTKKQEEIIKVLASKLGCLDEIEKLLKE